MKKKLTIGAIVMVMVLGIGAWFVRGAEAENASPYRTGTIAMGTIESTVTSTGRLTAIQSVAVGTQVSGQVTALYVDYNDRVREGQLLARIDPIIQEQSLRNAEASLERVRAALQQAIRDSVRNATLFESQIITQTEMDQVEYSLTVARANLISAEVSVEQAARNLAYTEIYSPIDGVVVERNVEIGQTVAASMSAPQLYLLATDLAQIEILANVDESDIGLIRNGMPVRFTVSAYPNDRFEGVVRQVRLSSATQENVVNYTAVISVNNADLRLVPGMTAEVDFIAERAEQVFMVPNAALRFRPTDAMIAQLTDTAMIAIARGVGGRDGAMMMQGGTPGAGQMSPSEGARAGGGARPTDGGGMAAAQAPRAGNGTGQAGGMRRPAAGTGQGANAGAQTPVGASSDRPASAADNGVFVLGGGAAPTTASRPGVAPLWYTSNGRLGVLQVRTGISDGTNTEISGAGLEEGMEIIVGLNQADAQAGAGGTTNPFQQQRGGFGGPGGGGFGRGF